MLFQKTDEFQDSLTKILKKQNQFEAILQGKTIRIDAHYLADHEIRRFTKLVRVSKKMHKEHGFYPVHWSFGVLNWDNPNDDQRRRSSPVFIMPVEIKQERGITSKFKIQNKETKWFINPVLSYYFEKSFGINLWQEVAGDYLNSEGLNRIRQCIQENDQRISFDHTEESVFDWGLEEEIGLAPLNYRNLPIVKDYDTLIDNGQTLKDLTSRLKHQNIPTPQGKVEGLFNVLPSDPSQQQVIDGVVNNVGQNIQGPPGTGKSQTIVNCLTNAIATGKHVVVLSEKKTALNVIRQKLESVGLGELVLDTTQPLDELYQSCQEQLLQAKRFQNNPAVNHQRKQLLLKKSEKERVIRDFQDKLTISPSAESKSLIALLNFAPDSQEKFKVHPVDYEQYTDLKEEIKSFYSLLEQMAISSPVNHPVHYLNQNIFAESNLTALLGQKAQQLSEQVDLIKQALVQANLDEQWSLSELQVLFNRFATMQSVLERGLVKLLDKSSREARSWDNLVLKWGRAERRLERLRWTIKNWESDWAVVDLKEAVKILKDKKAPGVWERFWPGKAGRVLRRLRSDYRFEAHKVPMDPLKVLEATIKRKETEEELNQIRKRFDLKFNVQHPELVVRLVKSIRKDLFTEQDNFTQKLLSCDQNGIRALAEVRKSFDQLWHLSKLLLHEYGKLPVEALQNRAIKVRNALSDISRLSGILGAIYRKDKAVLKSLLNFDGGIAAFKSASINHRIESRMKYDLVLNRLDGDQIRMNAEMADDITAELLHTNALSLKQKVQAGIWRKLSISEKYARELNADEKVFKKDIKKALRFINHEAEKSRQHQPLRVLINEHGRFVKDMKPVWLLSIEDFSSACPVDMSMDLLIVDEASQIEISRAIPALFRASKHLIVGDHQQMPPTRFFQSETSAGEEEESLLSFTANHLRKEILNWHYRSESEHLINFSNRHFYQNRLKVVPDAHQSKALQYHYVEEGQFVDRQNVMEAKRVANLLKQKVSDGVKSIGIIAFSLKQQRAVEQAIDKLAQSDPIFATLLDQLYDAEEEMMIRNLENVQGDERDVVLLSLGYGRDENGRFNQRFGPLNRAGGERRLNVLITRARKELHIVASVLPEDFEEPRSKGAQLLRLFLKEVYGRNTLGEVSTGRSLFQSSTLLDKLYHQLKSEGLDVEYFQNGEWGIDLMVTVEKKKKIALMLDRPERYDQSDLYTELTQKNTLLKKAGWTPYFVFSKDLYFKPESVISQIKNLV